MKTCDDCFEDFEPKTKNQTVCEKCKPIETEYSSDHCAHLWKVFHSRGFKNQFELDEYQKVKKSYKKLNGRELPKVTEKIKGKKNG